MNRDDIERVLDQELVQLHAAANQNAPVYEVVVGNIGFVYDGTDRVKAEQVYWRYMGESKNRRGRAAGEMVTLFEDGEPIKEWAGDYGDD